MNNDDLKNPEPQEKLETLGGEPIGAEGIAPEFLEMAKKCKTMDELRALAAKEGIELADEELETVAGGWVCTTKTHYTCIMRILRPS